MPNLEGLEYVLTQSSQHSRCRILLQAAEGHWSYLVLINLFFGSRKSTYCHFDEYRKTSWKLCLICLNYAFHCTGQHWQLQACTHFVYTNFNWGPVEVCVDETRRVYTLAPCCTILLFFNLWLQLLKVFICLNILTFSINPKPLGFKLCGGPLLLLFPFYISMFVGATAWVCDIIYKPGVSSIPWIYTSPLDVLLVRRGGDWKIHTPGSMIGGFKPEWPTTVWWAGSTSAGKSIHFSPYYR